MFFLVNWTLNKKLKMHNFFRVYSHFVRNNGLLFDVDVIVCDSVFGDLLQLRYIERGHLSMFL